MLDFNNSLTKFTGRNSGQEAQLWLNYIESVIKLQK